MVTFYRVGDFLLPKQEGADTRPGRRNIARQSYRLAKKMKRDLENNPELAEKIRKGEEEIKKPVKKSKKK